MKTGWQGVASNALDMINSGQMPPVGSNSDVISLRDGLKCLIDAESIMCKKNKFNRRDLIKSGISLSAYSSVSNLFGKKAFGRYILPSTKSLDTNEWRLGSFETVNPK